MTDFSTSQTIAGTLTDSVYDEGRGILYITTSEGLLLRWDVINKVFKSPLNLGGHLTSVAISPDDGFLLVGRSDMFNESGDQWDYVGHTQIDRVALNTLAVTPLDMGVTGVIRGVHDIAITADGMALVTNLDNGGSSTQFFRTFNAAGASVGTAVVHPGGSMFSIGFYTPSWLVTSSDERYVLVLEGNNSSGDFAIYDSQTAVTTSGNLWSFNNSGFGFNQGVGDISSDAGLFAFAASSGEFYVSDLSLHLVKNMTGVVSGPVEGLQFLTGGHQLLVWTTASGGGHEIQVYDTDTWAKVGTIANIPAPLANGEAMRITDYGDLLFLNTHDGSDGFEVIDLREHLSIAKTGDSGNNTLVGYLGDDTLSGGDGDDLLIAGPGDDALDGGAGNDTVSFQSAQFAVTASLAAGSAHGVDVNATLTSIENILGSANFDTLTGDAGANRIEGGAGFDTLTGGGGADVFVYNPGFDGDVITDLGADDVIDLSGMHIPDLATLQLFMTQDGADVVIGFGDYSIRLSNKTLADLTAANFAFYTSNAPLNVVGTPGVVYGVDVLFGGGGDDVLTGGPKNDKLLGGGGSDTANYSSAAGGVTADLAISGPQNTVSAGFDTLMSIENLNGSSFNDVLRGDGGANVLHGGAGDDVLEGRAGSNLLFGEAGFDFASYDHAAAAVTVSLAVTGAQNTIGAGTDTLSSVEGLQGSAFNDVLTGDAGANQLEGGAGDDLLIGGAGNDVLVGGAGIDVASYANAPDRVTVNLSLTQAQDTTSAGLDRLTGIEGLIGSAFNDNLQGSTSDDVINGGAGEDVIAATLGNDIVDGGAGDHDTLTYGGLSLSNGVTINLGLTTAQSNAGVGSITITNVEQLIGSSQNDILTGSAGANYILGGPGDDVIDGGAGGDNLDGGIGIDTVSYGSAAAGVQVSLAGGLGVDGSFDNLQGFENVSGSAFDDILVGDSGSNVLSGFAGNDTLRGYGGADTLDGGGGIDTASYDWASSAVTVSLANAGQQNTGGGGLNTLIGIENVTGSNSNDVIEGDGGNNVLNGGAGVDTVVYASATSAVTVDLTLATAQNTLGAGVDTLIGFENVTGSAFDDNLIGSAGDNVINGGLGRDTASYNSANRGVNVSLALSGPQDTGGGGVDTLIAIENLIGSNADDTLEGEAGDNLIFGALGIDTVSYAHAGAGVTVDLKLSTPQNTGGAGIDTLVSIENITGSAFNDTLTGDAGANVLNGGLGNDVLDGGAGLDTASYAGASGAVTVSLAVSGAQNTGGAGVDTLVSIENLTGSLFNDTLAGNAGANVIDGGAGFDTVSYAGASAGVTVNLALSNQPQNTGGGGVDTLIGIENVVGSAFNDTIMGNAGDNVLDGGAGIDTLSYEFATAGVWATLASIDARQTVGAGVDTVWGFENLKGSSFGDFLFGDGGANVIEAGDGNDMLFSGGGADTLTGGAGDDIFAGKVAELNGATITDFQVGDLIRIDDAAVSTINLSLSGATLSFTGNALNNCGALTLANLPSGYHLEVVEAGFQGVGNVIIGLVKDAPRILNNGLSGDFNGDGKDDLLWRSDSGQMSNWLGQANGGFVGNDANAFASVPTSWKIIGAGDFNGDGRDDILWRSDTGQMSNWLGTPSGGWLGNDANAFVNVPNDWKIAGVGDFNGDGKSDLLWRSDSGLMSDWLGTASGGWLANDANAFSSVPTNWHIIGVGDFNGDHRDDILWRSDTGQMSNWLGQANGGFAGNDANAFVNVPTDWHIVGVGDFNGDGRSDILWRSDQGYLSDWLGTASGGWAANDANAFTQIPLDWVVSGVGDYNGDGRDDIMWRNTSGAMSNWLGKASGGFTGNDANAYAVVDPSWHITSGGMFLV